MPKFLYSLLILSVGCLCGGAQASDNALFIDPDPFYVAGDEKAGGGAMEADPLAGGNPGDTVDGLSARANDWNEPSQKSELRYVYAIRKWLNSLSPVEQETARKILREAHPRMRALRVAIREKKSQLAAISFDRHTRPETLPRLGQELQALRAALRTELKIVDKRLREEAGVTMGPLGGDGFWLAPPTTAPYVDHPLPKVPPREIPADEKGYSHRHMIPVSTQLP